MEWLDCNVSTIAGALARHEIRAVDLVDASFARISAIDDRLQAFITLDPEGARKAARAADEQLQAGVTHKPLLGIPIAIKDVTRTKGLRTTQGSRLYADCLPDMDEESVARLRLAGAIIVGKTNTPEFAFGAVCTNPLRGPTCNPWDTSLTSAGSSGGSAVAVTTGMVPVAHGTDFGGSVRTPASFCGCVGLRPTPGVIPEPGRALGWSALSTQGVLSRSVRDAALTVSAMSGQHKDDPVSRHVPWPGKARAGPFRVAASATLGGAFRIDEDVAQAFDAACVEAGSVLGYRPIPVAPDIGDAVTAFKTLRAAESWVKFGKMVAEFEHDLTPAFVWNVRQGADITAEAYLHAEMARTRAWRSFQTLFENYDILMLPSASVMPFPNKQGEVQVIGSLPCESIIDYLACTFLVSLVGFPAISIPAPRGSGQLPFGVQLVARPGDEAGLLGAAIQLEEGGFSHVRPPSWPHHV